MHFITLPPVVRRISLLRRLLADQQGVAALEFALLLPLLSTMLLATADLTLLASRTYQVQSLAQAAANAIASLPSVPAADSSEPSGSLPSRQASSLPGRVGFPQLSNAFRDSASPKSEDAPLDSSRRNGPQGNTSPPGGITLPYTAPGPAPGLPRVSITDLVSLPEGASATNRLFWGCSLKAALVSTNAVTCPDGSRPAAYAEVVVRAPVNRLVAWPEVLMSDQVEARAIVRIG